MASNDKERAALKQIIEELEEQRDNLRLKSHENRYGGASGGFDFCVRSSLMESHISAEISSLDKRIATARKRLDELSRQEPQRGE